MKIKTIKAVLQKNRKAILARSMGALSVAIVHAEEAKVSGD